MNRFGFLLLFCFAVSTSIFCQKKTIDSLLKVIGKTPVDTIKVSALIELSNICSEADIEKYSSQAYSLSERLIKSNDPKTRLFAKRALADAANNCGYGKMASGDNETAIKFYQESLKIRNELKNYTGMAECLINIGYIYEQKGDIDRALKNYFKAMDNNEKVGNKSGMAYALNNMGFIYQKQGDLNKALEYYQKSKLLREEINDKHGLSQSLTNLGAIYKLQKNYEEALKTHLKSLEIQNELDDQSGISNSLNNIGYIYEYKNEIDSALKFYERAYNIRVELDEKKGMANSLNNLGRIYLLKGNMEKAFDCANKSHALALKLGYPENIKNSSKLLSSIYKRNGRFKESLEMIELFFKMHDSISNESTRKNTAKQQLQYEYGKRAIADSVKFAESQKLKDVEIKVQKTQIENDRNKKWALIGGLFLVVVFAAFMYQRVKITQRQKKIIEEQKRSVEIQKEMVDQKQKEILDSINYAKRIQYALLAHEDFLKNNLPEHFIYFQPKDIVSGDFYWSTLVKGVLSENKLASSKGPRDLFYLAVCDSTGHGVPGAFMSLLNIGFLSEAINEKNIYEPNLVLDYVRQRLTDTISNEGQRDGFDGILICFDKTNKTISYAAAQNSPVVIRNNEIVKLESNKMPVGMGIINKPFDLFTPELFNSDMIYFYTDGMADQFGGPKGKKYKYKKLNEFLLSIQDKNLKEQKDLIKDEFENWRGNLEQVDDVCIIGIKL